MPKNDTLKNLLLAGAVFLLAMFLVPRLFPPPKTPTLPTDAGNGTPDAALPDGANTEVAATGTNQPTHPASADAITVAEAKEVQTTPIGSDPITERGKGKGRSSPYRMRMIISNLGASVESVLLTDHAEVPNGTERYQFLAPIESAGTTQRSLAIEKINIDGSDVTLTDKRWNLVRHEPYRSEDEEGELVEFSVDLERKGEPFLKITRTLKLPKQSFESGRHDVYSDVVISNLSAQPHQVVLAYRGGVGVRQADPRMDDRAIDFGNREPSNTITGHRRRVADLYKAPSSLIELFSATTAAPSEKFSWSALANQYFTCTVAPLNRARNGEADYIASVAAYDADNSATSVLDVTDRIVTRAEQVPAGGELTYPTSLYIGEKDSDSFKTIEEYRSRNYYYQVVQGYGYCTFSGLVTLMIWLLNHIHWVIPDYGLAIIVMVLIVRTLLHPITKKGQVNMVRMQHRMSELQPKIEEIKKKYANDKARMNQEMMKLNLNPAGQLVTCLPMFIQLPIWAALYLSLSHNVDMRHEPFLFTWIRDLTAPDALIRFSAPIVVPGLGWTLPSFNLLPLLVAFTMYLQQRLTPKPKPNPNMSEEQRIQQETMQKMMPMMSIMMLFIFYKMPSGLNLYIMSSSIFGAVEQWHIRKHIREQEAAGTLHKPERKIRPPENGGGPRRPGGGSFFGRLQAMAEDARKLQRSPKPKK